MEEELPMNPHIATLLNNQREGGVKPGSGHYDVYTHTINTDKWGGRSVDFQVTNLSLNRLVIGSRCYMNFRCVASKNDDTDVLTADPIELRDGAPNLIFDSLNVRIAGTPVHTDNNAVITRHWYEHLNTSEAERKTGMLQHRYIAGESAAFEGEGDEIYGGLRRETIRDGAEFSLQRNLDEVAFFGHRDSAIPGALPISINAKLNSVPARLFNTDETIEDAPKLKILDVELYIYSVEMEDQYAILLQEALITETLTAAADKWETVGTGSGITASTTLFTSTDTVQIETMPDLLGIAFFPDASFNAADAYKGQHPLTTSWLNIDTMDVRMYGRPWRHWKQLSGSPAQKCTVIRELGEVLGCTFNSGVSPIRSTTFLEGYMSFFPVVNRPLYEKNVLAPQPTSVTFSARMSPNAAVNATSYVFMKMRHLWKLSTIPGKTEVLK